MAKKKESTYNSWEEVNTALKNLANLQIEKREIENIHNKTILEITQEFEKHSGSIMNKIKNTEKEISLFAEQRKSEFSTRHTKKLTFGKISYRCTKRISVKNVKSAIQTLKTMDMDAFIKTKESIDKESLLQLADVELAPLVKAGINLVREDKINIEPDFIEIANIDEVKN